jgi:chaperonin GroES
MVEAEEKTAGGIILAGAAKEQPEISEVIEVGPGKVVDGKLIPMQVEKGDKVICSYTGKKVKYEGEEYRIVSQDDILAKIL